jgi:hypothetical protein
MSAKGANREVRKLLAAVEATPGWRWKLTRKNHVLVYPADPEVGLVLVPYTPSDQRAVANARADLRRAGLPL